VKITNSQTGQHDHYVHHNHKFAFFLLFAMASSCIFFIHLLSAPNYKRLSICIFYTEKVKSFNNLWHLTNHILHIWHKWKKFELEQYASLFLKFREKEADTISDVCREQLQCMGKK